MKLLLRLAKRYWYILIIIAVVGGIYWWIKRPQPVTYQEYQVTRQPLTVTLTASGSLAAHRQANLKFQSAGRLAWVGVREGDRVGQWQAIASLDRRSLEKNLQKELNDYLKTRWDFQDNRDTYGVTTDNLDKHTLTAAARRVLEKSQFDLNSSVLDVEIQTVAKEFATVLAPFSGIVAELAQPAAGVNVSLTDPIATVIDPTSMYFSAEIDELDIAGVLPGQSTQLTLDAYPDEPLDTTVSEIGFSPITLSGGGTGFEVKFSLPVANDALRYKLGMNGDAAIVLAEKPSALVLPLEAVVMRDDLVMVQQQVGDELVEKEIRTGLETDEYIEVTGGLSEGDTVVVRNGQK